MKTLKCRVCTEDETDWFPLFALHLVIFPVGSSNTEVCTIQRIYLVSQLAQVCGKNGRLTMRLCLCVLQAFCPLSSVLVELESLVLQ